MFAVKGIEKESKKEGLGRKEKSLRDSLAKERKGKKKKKRMRAIPPPKKKQTRRNKGVKKKKKKEGERNPSVTTLHTDSLALRDGCSSDHLSSKERRGGGGGV